MRRLDNEKVIDYLSTLGLSTKERISSDILQEKFDKFEKVYNPDNETTGNAIKYKLLKEAFDYLVSNIFNVNLLIENDFNQDDYMSALAQVEEKQREFREKEAQRMARHENAQVQESILRAREAVAIEDVQDFYKGAIDQESKPYLLSYADYSKKGNKKINTIVENYKNDVSNIKNKEQAESKVLEFKQSLKSVLKRKEEKHHTARIIFIAFLIFAFAFIPSIFAIAYKVGSDDSIQTAETQLYKNNFSEAKRLYGNCVRNYDMNMDKELELCDSLILVESSISSKDIAYLHDGMDRLIELNVPIKVNYLYTKCKIKSLLVNIKYTENIDKVGAALYKPEILGYQFNGWTTSKVEYDDTVTITLEADLTPIKYNITYYTLNGATANNPSTYTIESTVILSAPTPTPDSFEGWYDVYGNLVKKIVPGTTGDKVLFSYIRSSTVRPAIM